MRTFHPTGAALLAWLLCASGAAWAQDEQTSLSVIKAPAQVAAGQTVSVTVEAGNRPSRWCGLVVDFGDGDVQQVKIGSGFQFPVTLSKTYARGGSYTIKAFGRKITTHSPCSGDATAQIAVAAPAQARAPAPAPAIASSACPQTVNIRNAAGSEVPFGLRQMVADAGGVQAARDQVAQRLMDTQARALDDAVAAPEREKAKQFAGSLRTLRDILAKCQ